MLLEVNTFCSWVENNLNGLIDSLSVQTSFYGENHKNAWRKSLPQLSKVLSHSRLSGFHLQIGEPGSLSIEYNLPASSSWCDAVLLGRNEKLPVAIMLELKDWDFFLCKQKCTTFLRGIKKDCSPPLQGGGRGGLK